MIQDEIDEREWARPSKVRPPHPGVLLREAREKAGLEQREIAEDLYLTLHYVDAIERGEFSRLPGTTFVRGYLRSYARRVKLSEDRVLEAFDEYARDTAESDRRRRRWQDGDGDAAGPPRLWLLLGAVLLILVGLGLYAALEGSDEDTGGQESMAATPGAEAEPAPATRLGSTPAPTAPESQVPAADAGSEGAAGQPVDLDAIRAILEESSTDAPGEAAATPEAAAPPPAVDRFEQKSGTLELHFDADSWIRVKDASGSMLANGLKRAGQSVEVRGESPYSIRIGNVSGTRLRFNGEWVDLKAHARNNIANFVLN